jgi:nitrite reductase/ring-hydroxylating ferredoxin subunit/DMSO/TMAO reductase YedYZ heme-binding membrane subunit
MSVHYQAVLWNRQKRIYDSVVGGGVLLYLAVFCGVGALIHPNATVETLLIRGLGTAALLLLHVILCIGPLCRLDKRFLPLLYNRRHLGVTMFVLALAHGVFSFVQFHALGDVNPVVSLLTSNTRYGSLASFPFQQLGAAALVILFLMAATSHDFWLHTLSPPVWKRLHMLVYVAYALLIAHVALGALQSETSWWLVAVLGAGVTTVVGLHLTAAFREASKDQAHSLDDDFVEVCAVESIPDNCAKVATVGQERVAVFRYGDRISAVSNVCRHQNGPLGEGRIIDGCITCPWHGYQYRPEDGCSPPPFTDKIPTYRTRVVNGKIFVHLVALPPGTRVEPSLLPVLKAVPR